MEKRRRRIKKKSAMKFAMKGAFTGMRVKVLLLLSVLIAGSAIIAECGLYRKSLAKGKALPAESGANRAVAPPAQEGGMPDAVAEAASEEESAPEMRSPVPVAAARPPEKSAGLPLRFPEQHKAGVLAVIIDDAGNNLNELEPFLRYPGPLTIAVLPGLPHSAEAARRIRAAGKELFLHQPMEALGGEAAGPGALYSGMAEEEIRRILEKNLRELGPVAGINNHQGSKATADPQLIAVVLAVCKEKKIAFLDSRTTTETVVPRIARELAFPFAARDIFLDNDKAKPAIVQSFNRALAQSARQDAVIMIGHAHSRELPGILNESLPQLYAHGYRFTGITALVNGSPE